MPKKSNGPRRKLAAVGSDQPATDEANSTEYEVGYRKPPKASQFPPGRSGNPRGSKKKTAVDDFRIVVEDVLEEPVKLRDGDRSRTVSTLEAMLRAQRRDALKGDPKAVKAVFKLAPKTGLFTQARLKSLIVLDPAGNTEQQMILKAFYAEVGNPVPKAPKD